MGYVQRYLLAVGVANTILTWNIWVITDYLFCHMLESLGKAPEAVVQQLIDVRRGVFIILALSLMVTRWLQQLQPSL